MNQFILNTINLVVKKQREYDKIKNNINQDNTSCKGIMDQQESNKQLQNYTTQEYHIERMQKRSNCCRKSITT